MSIRNIAGGYEVTCDECGITLELNVSWDDVSRSMIENGWKTCKLDTYLYEHYCPECWKEVS